jgi:cell division septation protein DedD
MEMDMKNPIMVCIMAALLVLTGASVWEGAASIAPLGELPDNGFYAATNSFPRNTVVDITNLETGQSIRVIVAAGLETPGLLALLSREAAGMIGLRSRSIGRIRMTQPSDPVAFSRFTEGLDSSGDPDYDPEALVNADPVARAYAESPGDPAVSTGPAGTSPAAGAGALAPEDMNRRYDEIVDIPDYYNPAADEGIIREEAPAPVYTWEDEPPAALAEAGDTEADPWGLYPAETPETHGSEAPETSEAPRGIAEPGFIIADEPAAPLPDNAPGTEEAPPPVETAEAEIPPAETPPLAGETAGAEALEFGLVPAEERPPEDGPVYEIPPELVIDSIPKGSAYPERAAAPEPVMDESQFVAPLGTVPAASTAVPPPPPAYIEPPLPDIFSVPLIHNLERGKYYLQIGAFSRTEPVESLIAKVGNGYPLAVQNGGSEEKPVYRLLIGPVNLGESGALLQRFKSIGYGDAFVRQGS